MVHLPLIIYWTFVSVNMRDFTGFFLYKMGHCFFLSPILEDFYKTGGHPGSATIVKYCPKYARKSIYGHIFMLKLQQAFYRHQPNIISSVAIDYSLYNIPAGIKLRYLPECTLLNVSEINRESQYLGKYFGEH